MIEARHVSVRRRQRLVLQEVSMTLTPGELLVVMGPNGAGKSTLVDALAGTLTPASGSVLLDGRPLAEWEPRALARRRAVLPQATQVSVALRAWQVVALGRLAHAGQAAAASDQQAVRDALARADAGALALRSYATLSGGERQRVQLARVLAQLDGPLAPSRFLLLDEPTASLDPQHQHALLDAARQLAAEGYGVLAVLHDANLAAQYADRVVVLDKGHVAAQGVPAEVLEEQLIRRVFAVTLRRIALPGGRFALATTPSGGRAPGRAAPGSCPTPSPPATKPGAADQRAAET